MDDKTAPPPPPGASYVCPQCSRVFPKSIALGEHIARTHPDSA